MAEENLFVYDHTKALSALAKAKALNARKTVPVRINSFTVVYITPEQREDPTFMKRLRSLYK